MRGAAVIATMLVLGSACAHATTETVDSVSGDLFWDTVETNGAFRFAVRDSATRLGIDFALPTIQSLPGAIAVSNTRYGSRCAYDVTGRAEVQGSKIGVHVTFSDRLTSCSGEPRALSYLATLSELTPGQSYTVAVIHEEHGRADTLRKAVVVVR